MVDDALLELRVALVSLQHAAHHGEGCLTSAVLDELHEARDDAYVLLARAEGEDSPDPADLRGASSPPIDFDSLREALSDSDANSVDRIEEDESMYTEHLEWLSRVLAELDVAKRALNNAAAESELPHSVTTGEVENVLGSVMVVRNYVSDDWDTEIRKLHDRRLDDEREASRGPDDDSSMG